MHILRLIRRIYFPEDCIYLPLHQCVFIIPYYWLPWWLSGKESACQCRRHRLDPWIVKIPWRRKRQPLQYSCLENPMGR